MIQLLIRRKTIGATAFERFEIKIYDGLPTARASKELKKGLFIEQDDVYEQGNLWINNGQLVINEKLPYEFYIRIVEGTNAFDFKVTQ
ncbi:hypothetical protein AAOE16_08895 [Ekhidna sp. MALMAid0563]|uniref:hypothetical protein n=1 Tax=Ekhidna sp. MALMAid0563 TaxID=3143937 RepID=UPI0032DF2148